MKSKTIGKGLDRASWWPTRIAWVYPLKGRIPGAWYEYQTAKRDRGSLKTVSSVADRLWLTAKSYTFDRIWLIVYCWSRQFGVEPNHLWLIVSDRLETYRTCKSSMIERQRLKIILLVRYWSSSTLYAARPPSSIGLCCSSMVARLQLIAGGIGGDWRWFLNVITGRTGDIWTKNSH